jgi:hypothetical protein
MNIPNIKTYMILSHKWSGETYACFQKVFCWFRHHKQNPKYNE